MEQHDGKTVHRPCLTCGASHPSSGFALLAVMGVLAILAIGMAVLVPNMVSIFDQRDSDEESKNLAAIGKGTQTYLQTNRSWPLLLNELAPDYVPFANVQLAKNSRNYLRYFAPHPTMLTFVNPVGLATAGLTDARFLVISDLSTNANPIMLLPAQFESWWNTNETQNLRIYKGNLAGLFPRVTLSSTGPGGSFQIDGLPRNSSGLLLSKHDLHHVRGTQVGLDESNVYSTPEIEFSLTTDVTYTFVPCQPVGRRWIVGDIPPCPVLLLTTEGSASGAPGLDSWTDAQIVKFTQPNLTYESGPTGQTSGNFKLVFDLDNFTGNANLDAIHYVTTTFLVGGHNPITLNQGDLLLSTDRNETLTSTNALSVRDKDVFVFHPDTPGVYTSGTFFLLIDGSDLGLRDIKAVTLVELPTVVGITPLLPGSFLLSDTRSDVRLFVPTSLGSTTSGLLTLFIDGSDIGIRHNFSGLELIESQTETGDVTLQPGQILGTLDGNDTVGSNNLQTRQQDVFILNLLTTGFLTSGSATLLFDGNDVNLSSRAENLVGITINGQ